MITRILVPLDESPAAEHALPYARALARTLQVPVTLLAVVDTPADLFTKKPRFLDTLVERSAKRSEEYLEKISLTFSGADIRCRLERGKAEDVIIMNAAADPGTLIAMASHGRSGLDHWLLGSTAEKVVRAANNPVLVVRANPRTGSEGETMLDSIIVPLDGAIVAECVLSYVVQLASAFHAHVILLRAYSLKQIIFNLEEFHPDLDELKGQLKWEAETYLEEKAAELKNRGLEVSCSAVDGDAADTIIDTGKGTPNALIAMSTHSAPSVRRWVLGSVTEKALRHATNPVLTIRA